MLEDENGNERKLYNSKVEFTNTEQAKMNK